MRSQASKLFKARGHRARAQHALSETGEMCLLTEDLFLGVE